MTARFAFRKGCYAPHLIHFVVTVLVVTVFDDQFFTHHRGCLGHV